MGALKFSCMVILLWTLSLLSASANVESFGQWTGLFAQGKFQANWGWFLESQTRLYDGHRWDEPTHARLLRGNRLMIRPAIRYLPRGSNHVQWHLGYGWTPNLSPFRDESRLYQQYQYQTAWPDWFLAVRLRLEERWIEGTAGTALRWRSFARVHRHLGADGWISLAVTEELFWNLNSVVGGPVSGFDQNRLFIGPYFKMSPQWRLEVGYLNQHSGRGRDSTGVTAHIYGLFVYFDADPD